MAHELEKLPYAYDALEPFIDKQTMEIHHTKHHKTYLDKLIMAVSGTSLENMELEDILMSPGAIDETIKTAVLNNGGGVFNHNFFWKIMGPPNSNAPEGGILEKINETFGSFQAFKEEFNKSALSLFGSGWTWLVQGKDGKVMIMNTQNQVTPISEGYRPILALDIWEHAYYLKYQNRRADYISNWWNVVNWKNVSQMLA